VHSKPTFRLLGFRWAIDRLKAESGPLSEIIMRWAQECDARQNKLKRKYKVWYHQLNLLQNDVQCFFHQVRRNPGNVVSRELVCQPLTDLWFGIIGNVYSVRYPGWIEETESYEMEKMLMEGMYDVIQIVQTHERGLVADQKQAEAQRLAEERRLERERQQKEQEAARLVRL